MLAPAPAFATLPIIGFVVGIAAGTLPTGWIARRYGRRAAFMVGTGFGVATGLSPRSASCSARSRSSASRTFFGGLYAAVVQSFRFAAADRRPGLPPRALSWVMAGGVFAGVLGPQLVTWTMDLWPPYLFAASFLAQAVIALLAMAVFAGLDLPRRPPTDLGQRPAARARSRASPASSSAAICGDRDLCADEPRHDLGAARHASAAACR